MHRVGIGGLVLSVVLFAWGGPSNAGGNKEAKFEMTPDEKTLLELLNKSRAAKKLPPLKPNAILTKVARAHSANMLKQGKMAHVLDRKGVAQRVDAAGYDYRSVGENLAFCETRPDDKEPLPDIHKRWMNSKVHRDNILAKRFQEVGLGLARDDKGHVYCTQVFATLRKNR
jgi:uncharacterized protein YkwD